MEFATHPVDDGILSSIGNPPLIRLRRLLPEARFQPFGHEALNPGGGIEHRPALVILEDALRSGEIGPDNIVIESSSGNMGIDLAQACRYHGLRFLCCGAGCRRLGSREAIAANATSKPSSTMAGFASTWEPSSTSGVSL